MQSKQATNKQPRSLDSVYHSFRKSLTSSISVAIQRTFAPICWSRLASNCAKGYIVRGGPGRRWPEEWRRADTLRSWESNHCMQPLRASKAKAHLPHRHASRLHLRHPRHGRILRRSVALSFDPPMCRCIRLWISHWKVFNVERRKKNKPRSLPGCICLKASEKLMLQASRNVIWILGTNQQMDSAGDSICTRRSHRQERKEILSVSTFSFFLLQASC